MKLIEILFAMPAVASVAFGTQLTMRGRTESTEPLSFQAPNAIDPLIEPQTALILLGGFLLSGACLLARELLAERHDNRMRN